MKYRIGKIQISHELLEDVISENGSKTFSLIDAIYSIGFLPLAIEPNSTFFEYIGYSEKFDEIDEEAIPPVYKMIMNWSSHTNETDVELERVVN